MVLSLYCHKIPLKNAYHWLPCLAMKQPANVLRNKAEHIPSMWHFISKPRGALNLTMLTMVYQCEGHLEGYKSVWLCWGPVALNWQVSTDLEELVPRYPGWSYMTDQGMVLMQS